MAADGGGSGDVKGLSTFDVLYRLPGSLRRELVPPLFLVSHEGMSNAMLSTYKCGDYL